MSTSVAMTWVDLPRVMPGYFEQTSTTPKSLISGLSFKQAMRSLEILKYYLRTNPIYPSLSNFPGQKIGKEGYAGLKSIASLAAKETGGSPTGIYRMYILCQVSNSEAPGIYGFFWDHSTASIVKKSILNEAQKTKDVVKYGMKVPSYIPAPTQILKEGSALLKIGLIGAGAYIVYKIFK